MKISVIIFLIIGLGVIVYSNSLGNDFIWDDDSFVIRNDFIKNLKLIPRYFTSKEALAEGPLCLENYRPFLVLSYSIDYYFWKLNPLGYHITNLIFHILNAIFVFYLIMLLTKDRFIGLLTSLFFLTHPIQTEAVSWISGRADVLFLFFYLASLVFYIIFVNNKKLLFYIFSLLLFSFSLLSKEMAASLPLVLILLDIFYGKKEKIGNLAIRYLPFFLILESYVFVRFYIIGRLAQADYWAGNFYMTILSMAKGITYYIKLLIYPANLCADYLRFPISNSIADRSTIFSVTFIVFIIILAIYLARKIKEISFSIFWFFITLLPAANIIPIRILIAERFLYLPSIGFCFIIAILIMVVSSRIKRMYFLKYFIFSYAVFLIFIYSYLTMLRNVDWSDEVVFWKKNVDSYPNNERAHLNLSVAYLSRYKDIEKAYKEAKKAIAISPRYSRPRMIVASYFVNKNRFDDAAGVLSNAIKRNPEFLEPYVFLGGIYAFQGKYDLAYKQYRKALARDPYFLEAKLSIAVLHTVEGNPELAISEYERILKEEQLEHYRSHYAAAYLRFGELYANLGDNENAIKMWNKVYEDFSDQIWFYEISKFLVDKTSLEEALKKIESWQPDFKIMGYYFVGIKKEMSGDYKEASKYYNASLNTISESLTPIKTLAKKHLDKIEGQGDI